MAEPARTLADVLSERRKTVGISQQAVADHLDTTQSVVSAWENDQACPDGNNAMVELAALLGIGLEELVNLAADYERRFAAGLTRSRKARKP